MMKRWNWGHSIALGYTAFALGTVGLLAYATRQPEELVSPDYYAEALRYDRVIDAARNVRELGPAFHAAVSPDGRHVVLTFPADQGSTAVGTVTFYRPSDSQADRHAPLLVTADNTQDVSLVGLAPGLWHLRVDWTVGARSYYYEQSLEAR